MAISTPSDTGSLDSDWEAAAGPLLEDLLLNDGPAQNPSADAESPVDEMPPAEGQSAPAVRRVGIQAGHWRSAELPDELARLRTSTGTYGGGVAEWELNLDIARRVVALLNAEGFEAEVVPATVPPAYKADVFVSLHADGDVTGRLSGFKLARAVRSEMPEIDDALLGSIQKTYRAATGLAVDHAHVSRAMLYYYAFAGRRLQHTVAATTPAVILEMGFLTNASDRQVLLGAPDAVAEGIALGIMGFLQE